MAPDAAAYHHLVAVEEYCRLTGATWRWNRSTLVLAVGAACYLFGGPDRSASIQTAAQWCGRRLHPSAT